MEKLPSDLLCNGVSISQIFKDRAETTFFFIINRKLLTRGAGDSLASKNFVVVTTLPANLTAWLALAVPL